MDSQNTNSKYNYYDILEVSPHSQQHEITAAYERAKATYSGENTAIYTIFSPEEARDLLKLIEEAYSVLGSKTLRTIYDEKISQGVVRSSELSYEAIKALSQTMYPENSKKSGNFKPAYSVAAEMEHTIVNQLHWSGDFLKKVREYKQVTVERLSEVTKINTYYIRAIEDMRYSELPAPVFIRGYLLQMAKALQLDEKKVADSYMQIYKANIPT